ncbi:hypothetical protein [Thiobacillus sp.]|uniref:hypothetical protein n=1 Tax=Thiobacillus sp. TaxID=924 RepID=UPI0025CF989D|nr:hypothetical protein [Thiobacillus sp.]
MTMAFDGRIAISGLVPLTPTKIVKPENFSPPEIVAEPSQAEIDAQIRRQNAEPTTAVFRVNGQIVAAMRNSGTFFPSSAGAVTDGRALDANALEAALRQRHGNALRVERYPAGTGPAFGAILAEVYGGKGYLVDTRA